MIKKFDQVLESSLKWILICAVMLMLGLTLFNIFMRYFNMAFHWIDPLVRHLVFLCAFLGGALATGSGHHIKIDLLSNILEKDNKKAKNIVQFISTIVTGISCILVTYAAYLFALSEFEYGSPNFLGIHSGILVSIIPFGMGVIALRTFCKAYLLVRERN